LGFIKRNWEFALIAIPTLTELLDHGKLPSGWETSSSIIVMTSVTTFLIWEFRREKRIAEVLSVTDQLTGLYNIRYLNIELPRLVAFAHRSHTQLSLMFLDLDNFKSVNDNHGHDAGNNVLQAFAGSLQKLIRTDMDMCFRFGGDEFVIVCPHTDLRTSIEIAKRVVNIPGSMPEFRDNKVTLSLGLVHLNNTESHTSFLKRADEAMYHIKMNGKNGIGFGETRELLSRLAV